ncbi:MAG: DsrE family protein [Blastocatellia bacterium]|nr:DsrE family protein [Blastocatellia bacterium]MCS7158579.1 DsrE family protein [Blastocatellia bacterium]MDW8169295.1 DsrE family protein [Acidobacteriota bacterium]MDW8257775.1 DsrE family protein [Acidobacteriota bacterium]
MKKVAIIVSNGSFNNLFQVSTLIRALTASQETSVRVFFRDEAIVKVTRARINELNFSDLVRPMESEIMRRLREADFVDLHAFLRDSKEHGDDVRLFACTSSMYMYGVREEDLIPEIDGARTLTDFLLEEVSDAEKVFTF